MSRLLAAFLMLLPFLAQAQATTADTPAEPINTVGVIAFLVLFIGSILGFIAYVWWQARHPKPAEE